MSQGRIQPFSQISLGKLTIFGWHKSIVMSGFKMLNHVPRHALIENHRNAALDLAWLVFYRKNLSGLFCHTNILHLEESWPRQSSFTNDSLPGLGCREESRRTSTPRIWKLFLKKTTGIPKKMQKREYSKSWTKIFIALRLFDLLSGAKMTSLRMDLSFIICHLIEKIVLPNATNFWRNMGA